MRDAGIDVVEFLDSVVTRELAADALIGSVLLGLCGRDVIEHDGDARRIEQFRRAELLHDVDGTPSCRMAHHQIGGRVDDATRLDVRYTGSARKDLLRDGLAHDGSTLFERGATKARRVSRTPRALVASHFRVVTKGTCHLDGAISD